MDSISTVALSFMVHEPSGIMVRSRARSLSESLRRYRSIAVSERCRENTGWVMKEEVRRRSSGRRSPRAVPSAVPPKTAAMAATCSGVVVSSQEMPRWSASTRRRL